MSTARSASKEKPDYAAAADVNPIGVGNSVDTADPTPSEVKKIIREIYLAGKVTIPGVKFAKFGQPRFVAATTGGGGQLLSYMLCEPGASSALLEAVVPYDKESCVRFAVGENQRDSTIEAATRASLDTIGFCSEEMAVELAEAARDRCIALTPRIVQWADCKGVAQTATIVSHYTRRGAYRAHAAAAGAVYNQPTKALTHVMTKGARGRAGEDAACALLSMRALAEVCPDVSGESRDALTLYGVRTSEASSGAEAEPVNAVKERAAGVEEVPAFADAPVKTGASKEGNMGFVLAPGPPGEEPREVVLPRELPRGTLVVLSTAWGGADAALALANAALAIPTAVAAPNANPPPIPVLFRGDRALYDALAALAATPGGGGVPPNWGVWCVSSNAAGANDAGYQTDATNVSIPRGAMLRVAVRLTDLNDGSPSTTDVAGVYCGGWAEGTPEGQGVMAWDNGITYKGSWRAGAFHGWGGKYYSRGGGYEGSWVRGKRLGQGVSLYGGKWGYEKWIGPFVNDKPHGFGVMTMADASKLPMEQFEFKDGEPVTKVEA